MIVSVTGGVGSGKTTFVHFLGQRGAETVDVDVLARDLIDGSETIQTALRNQFGDKIFNSDGALDRTALGRIVFSDRDQLDALNQLVWPPLLAEMQSQILHYRESMPHRLVVFDMAVLFESGAAFLFDVVVVVIAPKNVRVQRLLKSRGWNREKIQNRMRSQMSDEEKIKFADYVIDNESDIHTLEAKARYFFTELIDHS